MRLSLALTVWASLSSLALGSARADDDDTRSGRHRIELAVGGGLSLLSDRPERFEARLGGQVQGRRLHRRCGSYHARRRAL